MSVFDKGSIKTGFNVGIGLMLLGLVVMLASKVVNR